MRFIVAFSVAALLLLAGASSAEFDPDPYGRLTDIDNGYKEELEVPWVEIETKVKTPPKADDLTRLDILALPAGMTLYADFKNIDINDKDRVIRTWLVVRSDDGAYNGTYEGLRCGTREYKIYAYDNPKRSQRLRVINVPRWRKVRDSGYRSELMQDYLCRNALPKTVHEIRDTRDRDPAAYVAPYAR